MAENFLWWRDGVIYQIYPRSFADSNGDGIGDLPGITGKLDYLAELGIDAIWLSPINPSPDFDFGYDVSDYKAIDPKYGTMDDFNDLVQKAHQHNIRVIMDLVLNHTSDQHPWFIESRSSRDNPHRDWYLWRENPSGKHLPPNNWQSIFGGKGWEFDEKTEQGYFHMFVKQQPDLNWRNPDVRKEMMSIFRFWAERGVDGFRLDVFNEYFKDAEFRDNPKKWGIRPFDQQKHLYDADQPEMMGVVSEIRQILDEYPERYAVGETFIADAKKAAEYSGEGKLHATFDFSFMHNPWRPDRFLRSILDTENLHTENSWPNYVMNNHDTKRSATRYKAPDNDERLKVAAGMLLTLRGTPFLYAGEEIGMRDVSLKRSELKDPVGVHYWPANVGRDGCRSPMQWSTESQAGFTEGKPWLKVHPNYLKRNVVLQKANQRSLLNFYCALLRIRKSNSALQQGMFVPLTYYPKQVLGYLRQDANQTVLVALNFGSRKVKLALGPRLSDTKWELLLSNKREITPKIVNGWLQLQKDEVCILLQK
jgi:alpha-glucosidase